MSRSKVDGEVWFWLTFCAIVSIIGGLIGLAFGAGFWIGFIVGLLLAWGIPFCGCIFD